MRAGRREWVALAVLALPTVVVTMDLSVLFLAVPKLTRDLQPTSAELLWITDIYGFMIAACLITMGTLGDRIGRRRLLLIGAGAFAVASLAAAFSTSAAMLIAARALLGVAAATLAPSALALIRNLFHDPGQRTVAIGIWISCFAAGSAIGPLVGGVLLEHFWWGSVFLPSVPVMALLLAAGPVLLPESRDPSPGRLDVVSAALSATCVLAVVYGVTRMAEHGAELTGVLPIACGLVLGAAFLRRQRRLAYPLVELGLFRSPTFSSALAAMLVSVFVVSGAELFLAQYLQLVRGIGPFVAGLWLLPMTIALIVGSMVAPLLVRRVRIGVAVAGGLALSSIGLSLLATLGERSTLALFVFGTALLGLGVGPAGTLGTDVMVGAAPPERAGAASALSETATELGGATGIAVLGSIGVAAYRSAFDDRAPRGVPARAAEASRDTLGGAADAAARLPAQLGDEVLHAARLAFTHGLAVAALVAAGVSAAMALVAVLQLRGARAET